MAKFLARLEFQSDFILGPEIKLPQDTVVHHYREKLSGKVLRTLLIGTVAAVIERKNEPKADPSSKVITEMFIKQTAVLNHVFQQETSDISRRIINKEMWSQGSGEKGQGAVYVRITDETKNDILNMSEDQENSPFKCIYQELPKHPCPPLEMAVGSTIICYVYPFRMDIPLPQSPNIEKVHGRVTQSS
ncbi:hypothetical protein DFH06DRAFT_1137497 [Mycena polygramma]|nr:hypothetical protein DFH06DRAFT_1137497 [Mycena polygramma]